MRVTTGYDTAAYRFPLGVTAGIVPMNYPVMIPWGWMVSLSIACGNTVVLKTSSQTPLTAMRIMELFYTEGGFPKGVVNLVTCSRTEADIYDLDAIICENDGMAVEAGNAADANSGIVIVGVDGTPDGFEAIKDGRITGTVSQNGGQMAANGIEAAVTLLDGKELETNTIITDNVWINAENVADYE